MRFFFFLLPVLLFLGCSSKINLADYRPAYVPKNSVAPADLSPKIKKVSIVKFPEYKYKNLNLSQNATHRLNFLLQNSKFVKILRIINENQIKDEIKAAEIAKETNSDIGADYLIKGAILNVTYTPKYHRGYYYYVKNKKGEKIIKYSPPYYSYEVCTQINIQILKLPEMQSNFDKIFSGCSYYSDNVPYMKFYPDLILKSLNKSVADAYNCVKKFFAPKGYIYEVRKDGDDFIAKITLGKNQGMKEGMKLNIYDLKKDPLSGKTEKYKIGEGEVSNIIFENSCWITVDTDDGKLKIGDMVEPSFDTSFWDLFR